MEEAEIVALKARLDSLSDQLNLRIRQEEDYLRMLGLGVHTFIKTSETSDIRLGYIRLNEGWRLVARQIDKLTGDSMLEWPLAHAPRGVRLHCCKHFEKLRGIWADGRR
jgi:hypothetical protein